MNHDGSYRVTFPGDKEHPVTVTDGDLEKYLTMNNAGWANILETAFLKMDNAKVDGGIAAIDFSRAPVVDPTQALSLLTGHGGTGHASLAGESGTVGTPISVLQNDIQKALHDGEPIIATSDPVPNGDGVAGDRGIYYPKPGVNWPIVGDHEFSVLGYDPKSQIIVLQNPWGTDDSDGQGGELRKAGQTVDGMTNEGNGQLKMSLGTFDKHLTDLDFATNVDSGSNNDICPLPPQLVRFLPIQAKSEP